MPFPRECTNRLNRLGSGYRHQPITEGNVPLANIDYYGVEITRRPDFNRNGSPDTEAEIYQAFRNNFTSLASGTKENFQFSCDIDFDDDVDTDDTDNIWWKFKPLTSSDNRLFTSGNPKTAILLINAGASGVLTNLIADEGAVIVSNFSNNNWTVSSIETPATGTQPFSGNRQWGWITNQNGNLELFTRAVDVANINKVLNDLPGGANTECQQDTCYNVAEATWKNMQQEMAEWINSNDGQARVVPKTAARVDREKIVELLTSNQTINQINCD